MTSRVDLIHDAKVAGRLAVFLDAARPLLRQTEAERERGLRKLHDRWRGLVDGGMARLTSEVGGAVRAARSAGSFANPWRIAGLKRREVPTAAVLAWFLSPEADHGAGEVFLQAFWREVTGTPPFPLRNVRRCATELVPLANEDSRVDLVLEGDGCLVFIEVKIDAAFQPDQLARYRRLLQQRGEQLGNEWLQLLLIGNLAVPKGVDCTGVSWSTVARALRSGATQVTQNAYAARLACDFAAHIETL